jgi:hypothetical protein
MTLLATSGTFLAPQNSVNGGSSGTSVAGNPGCGGGNSVIGPEPIPGTVIQGDPSCTGPSFVQAANSGFTSCNTTGTPATSCTTASMTVKAGSTLICVAAWFTNVTWGCSTNKSDVFTCGMRRLGGEYQQACWTFAAVGGSTAATSTWSGTGATFDAMGFYNYSGVNALDNVDIETNNTYWTGNSTSVGSTNVSASATHDTTELIFSMASFNTNFNVTAGTGYTLRSPASAVQFAVEDRDSPNGTYNGTMTCNSTCNWAVTTLVMYNTDSAQFRQESDHDDGVTGAVASDAFAYNVNVSSGDFLASWYVWVNNPEITISSVTSALGNTITCDSASLMADSATTAQFCHGFVTTPGAETLTTNFTSTGASFIGMGHAEFKNVTTIDQDSVTTGTSTTPTTPTVTTGQTELVLGWFCTAAGFSPWTSGTGWTARATSYRSCGFETKYAQPAGMYSAPFTSSNAVWAAGIVTLH